MPFMDLAAARCSVRAFSDKPVPADLLTKVLEAGRLAPTAMNRQPQRILVIQSPEAMQNLVENVRPVYGAPAALLICGDVSVAAGQPVVDHVLAEMDATIVTTHMMLEAADLGLGTCWMCAFNVGKAKAAFDLPDNIVPYVLLPIGYAAEGYEPNPRHFQRDPLDSTVTYL